MADESDRTVFNLGQDCVVSRVIEEDLKGQQIVHQLRNGR